MEFSNRLERFELIENLFRKVKKDGYLVLIEDSSMHSFSLINEARNFILNDLMPKQTESWSLFAPCPHQLECQMTNTKLKCRFFASYWPIDFLTDNKKSKVCTFFYILIIVCNNFVFESSILVLERVHILF